MGCFEGVFIIPPSLQYHIDSSLAMRFFCGLWMLFGACLPRGLTLKKVKGWLALDVLSSGGICGIREIHGSQCHLDLISLCFGTFV